MAIMDGAEILRIARREKYSIAGFDVFDYDSTAAIINAAEESNAPVFLQAGHRVLAHIEAQRIALIMRQAAEAARVPVVVHLDHGPEVTRLLDILSCLEAGFTSVMVDGSRLPLKENIELTQGAIKLARRFGASVEGEVGKVGRISGGLIDEVAQQMARPDDPKDWLTSIDEAVQYVNETGIDSLAVSVGSVSGVSSTLDLALLEAISNKISLPLVLHGGSGVRENDLRRAVTLGVAKVNFAHGLRRVYMKALREGLADGKNTDNPFLLLKGSREAMHQYALEKIYQLRGTR
jgi:ketose-bisphosphate aldolase